jgi:transcriptional regulator with XRE-family HTH domain
MGRLFDLVEAHRKRYEPYAPSYSQIAAKVGVSRQTLLNWREPTKLIDKAHLQALSEETGVPYHVVLDALLEDIGYKHPDNPAPPQSQRESG